MKECNKTYGKKALFRDLTQYCMEHTPNWSWTYMDLNLQQTLYITASRLRYVVYIASISDNIN